MNVTKTMRSDYFAATGNYGSDNEIWTYYFGTSDVSNTNPIDDVVANNTQAQKTIKAAELKCVAEIISEVVDFYTICNNEEPTQQLRTQWHYDIIEFISQLKITNEE